MNETFRGYGRSAVDGLVQGINDNRQSAINAAAKLSTDMANSAKKSAKINSPSKLFADEVGAWIPPGISVGIEKAMPKLDDDMRNRLQDMVDDANLSVAAEVSGFSGKLAASSYTADKYPSEPSTVTNDNGIVINLTYNGTSEPMDIKKISRQLGIETAREMRRRGIPAI